MAAATLAVLLPNKPRAKHTEVRRVAASIPYEVVIARAGHSLLRLVAKRDHQLPADSKMRGSPAAANPPLRNPRRLLALRADELGSAASPANQASRRRLEDCGEALPRVSAVPRDAMMRAAGPWPAGTQSVSPNPVAPVRHAAATCWAPHLRRRPCHRPSTHKCAQSCQVQVVVLSRLTRPGARRGVSDDAEETSRKRLPPSFAA